MWKTHKHSSWPRAIIHLDADAFFASCEQAIHPEYRGKPVITGAERGIAASMSYEAKRLGVKRAMTLVEIKKLIPNVIILPSDYETYSLFSKRMFAIMRRYTSLVEEYSIDEAFADISGLRRPLHMSYEQIARRMKDDIQRELGITVSVGLSVTKVLAKAAANLHKPDCFQIISARDIQKHLQSFPVEEVWGIGPQTMKHMHNLGIFTVGQFVAAPEQFVFKNFSKPHQEIWFELQGHKIYDVVDEEKSSYYSISKTRTFTPATSDKEYVFSQLVKNMESACIKARRYHLAAGKIIIMLRTQDFRHVGTEAKLSRLSNLPVDIIPMLRELFEDIFTPGQEYRLSGIVLADLLPDNPTQVTLFESPIRLERMKRLYEAVDALAARYGKHTVHLGASHRAHNNPSHQGGRSGKPERQRLPLKGETKRQRIGLPFLPQQGLDRY